MSEALQLPVVDLSSEDRLSTANSIRQVVFFINSNKECTVECLESCCSEPSPPRFPPIRSLDYLEECLNRLTYGL